MPRYSQGGVLCSVKNDKEASEMMSEQPRKKAKASSVKSVDKENASSPPLSTEAILLERVLDVLGSEKNTKHQTKTEVATAQKEVAAARQEAAHWKRQFAALAAVRETEPEARLSELRKELTQANDATQSLVAQVKASVIRRSQNVTPTHEGGGAASDDAEEMIEELELKLDNKRQLLDAYQRLTGVVIRVDNEKDDEDDEDEDDEEDRETTLQCTAINHIQKRVVQFSLTLPSTDDEGPRAGGDVSSGKADSIFCPLANNHLLPSDLQKPAEFHAQQLPILFHRMLKKLYSTSSPP